MDARTGDDPGAWGSQNEQDTRPLAPFAEIPMVEPDQLAELWKPEYPWADLFARLAASGYEGDTLAEIPPNDDPERVLHYYKALWNAYQP